MACRSVDTSTSVLKLYVGVHKDQLGQVLADNCVRACNVMAESGGRSWVPLHATVQAAAHRALVWGFPEMGKESDKSQLALFCFEFTAMGVGHVMLTNELTTSDWKHFRFHGNLPLQCTNMYDDRLVTVYDATSVDGMCD